MNSQILRNICHICGIRIPKFKQYMLASPARAYGFLCSKLCEKGKRTNQLRPSQKQQTVRNEKMALSRARKRVSCGE